MITSQNETFQARPPDKSKVSVKNCNSEEKYNNMEIEGKIIMDLGETGGISKAGNSWKKHEWVLETMGQYPRKVKFHLFGDRADTIRFDLMKTYKIQVDVESREFNGRWYTDLNCYQAQEVGEMAPGEPAPGYGMNPGYAAPQATPGFAPQQPAGPAPFSPAENDSSDDLPF